MKNKPVAFEDALGALGLAVVPTARVLRGLNSLDRDQLAELQSAWVTLDANRRAYLAEKLRELAEDDIDLEFTPIFHFTLSDVEEAVRLSSVEGLWEDETPGLIDPLTVLLRSDPSPLVRAAAASALGRFLYLGELDKISRKRRDQVYSALMGAILAFPPGSVVYQHALESVAVVSNEEVDRLIREAYASDNEALRVTALTAMGRSNNRQYNDIVREELNSVLPAMRAAAARACGELEIAETVPELGKLIDDSDTVVSLLAINALGQIGGDDARHLLEHAAASDDEDIAEAAEEALAEDELLHGDLKFSTSWFDEISRDGAGNKDERES